MSDDLPTLRLARELDRRGAKLDRVVLETLDISGIVMDPGFETSRLTEGGQLGSWEVDEILPGLAVGFKRTGSAARHLDIKAIPLRSLLEELQGPG